MDWNETWVKALSSGSKKRKLISVFEADGAARRLMTKEVGKERKLEMGYVPEESEDEMAVDDLHDWYGTYWGWMRFSLPAQAGS